MESRIKKEPILKLLLTLKSIQRKKQDFFDRIERRGIRATPVNISFGRKVKGKYQFFVTPAKPN